MKKLKYLNDIQKLENKFIDNLTPAEIGKLTHEELLMAENFENLTPGEKAEIEQIIRHR